MTDQPTPRDDLGGDANDKRTGPSKADALTESTDAFEKLVAEFQDVIKTLGQDKSLERFRLEYEKVVNTLRRSHENEKKLVTKCRELQQELSANASKMTAALRLSQ